MSNDKLIKRVQKLLAMANDAGSPNEAAIAARRARSLMDKHSLSQSDVEDLESGNGSFSEVRAGKSRRFMAKWEQWLAIAVADLNDCVVRRAFSGGNKTQVEFCGQEDDAAVARATFEYLVATVKRLCSQYMAEQGYTRYNARVGDSYKAGAARAIRENVDQTVQGRKSETQLDERTGTSLVVVKQQVVAQHYGHRGYGRATKSTHADPEATAARSRGHADGSKVSLNSQLEG